MIQTNALTTAPSQHLFTQELYMQKSIDNDSFFSFLHQFTKNINKYLKS